MCAQRCAAVERGAGKSPPYAGFDWTRRRTVPHPQIYWFAVENFSVHRGRKLMFRARPVLSTFVALSLLAPQPAALAQQAPSPKQTAPDSAGASLKVTSRLTLVDVIATDSKGESVRGLTKPDFTVKEERK